jgi:hypothetical protein
MSDELFEKDELEDEDVEAHKTRARVRLGSDEPEGAEDVEAHLKVRAAKDDDDSDDVEAHRRQA